MNSDAKTIVLAGGSGFLGSELARHFSQRGCKVIVLTRAHAESPDPNVQQVHWDAKTLGSWTHILEGSAAVINLAGRSINCRFTPENRKQILDSRIESTKALGLAIAKSQIPPSVWLNCSGIGIYNQSFDSDMDERNTNFSEAETGASFVSKVALLWERALWESDVPKTRKVALRISMVLGAQQGTAFSILNRLARFGLAGTMGSGRQFVSWIHIRDFCRALDWIIDCPKLEGPVNITAPAPVTNAEFMRTLRRASGRSIGIPAPAFALKLGSIVTGTEPDLILDSRRAVPARLLESGFKFDFPTCSLAMRDLTTPKPREAQTG